ncbi:sulfopyruvate decarboxylase subunit alpha [Methanocaldococcus sp.]
MPEAIYEGIKKANIDFICSVPCAKFKKLLELIEKDEDIKHIPVTREEEAFGICAGAYLTGKRTAIIMQNSGLGNSINAIGSLYKIYQIPTLLIISHRGLLKEEIPAQIPMGLWTKKLLDVCEIPYFIPKTKDEAIKYIVEGSKFMEKINYPVAILFGYEYWEK